MVSLKRSGKLDLLEGGMSLDPFLIFIVFMDLALISDLLRYLVS